MHGRNASMVTVSVSCALTLGAADGPPAPSSGQPSRWPAADQDVIRFLWSKDMKTTIQLILIMIILMIVGCNIPRYMWVNNNYSPAEIQNRLVIDQGQCDREANTTFPDPTPVKNPDDAYHECRANNRRQGEFEGRTNTGTTISGTVTSSGNPFACNSTPEDRRQYREYRNQLSALDNNRTKYTNSCMSLRGWNQIRVE